MIALVRCTAATLLHSQRYLAPVLLFTGVLTVLTVNGRGSLPSAYASSAGALFLCATWLTVVVTGLDDPARRAILAVSAGGAWKVLLASVATALACCTALMVPGLLLPLWTGSYEVTAGGPAGRRGGAGHGGARRVRRRCALLPQVLPRPGYALAAALGLVLAALFTQGLPPVNRLLHLLSADTGPASLLAPVGGQLAVAALLLAAAAGCGPPGRGAARLVALVPSGGTPLPHAAHHRFQGPALLREGVAHAGRGRGRGSPRWGLGRRRARLQPFGESRRPFLTCRENRLSRPLPPEVLVRVHHLDCGSLRKIPPLGGEHPGGRGAALPAVCHCLLLETEADGLVLVDSGLGTADRHDPEGRLGTEWVAYAQPARDPEESALR